MKGIDFILIFFVVLAANIMTTTNSGIERQRLHEESLENQQTIIANQDTLKQFFRQHVGVCAFELSKGAKEHLDLEYGLMYDDKPEED